ncbi:MAG: tetratricopeptide repeat protein [Nitrospirae bacterium]|nr:tetratricopeptide repeat protein [Nitrospirota bacterium]
MDKKAPRINGVHREIKKLKKKIAATQKQAKIVKGKIAAGGLAGQLDNLKNSLAWQYLDLGEYDAGLALYRELPWQTQREAKYNGIARALIEMEYYDEAGRVLNKGLKRFPESTPLLVGMGLLLRRLGYEFDAFKYFERALEFAPDDKSALYDKALALNDLGYHEDALTILKGLVEVYPDDPEYIIELGQTFYSAGLPEDSIPFFQKAKGMGYPAPGIYGGLFCAYMDLGMKKEALDIAQEGIEKLPDGHPGLHENLAEGCKEFGCINEARDVLHEGLKKFPDDDGLKKLQKDIEDEADRPEKDKKPLMIGLILLLTLLKKTGEKRFKK